MITTEALANAHQALDEAIDHARHGDWRDLFNTSAASATANTAEHLNLADDGSKLTFRKAMQGNDKEQWRKANDAELTRLTQTYSTMRGIKYSDIPIDRRRDVSYYNPTPKEKIEAVSGTLQQRVRGAYGGNLLQYAGPRSAKVAELDVIKAQQNAVVSERANYSGLDIKDAYLMEQLDRPEYLKIPTKLFTPSTLTTLGLTPFIDDKGFMYMEVTGNMYGLPQAGFIFGRGRDLHLTANGYREDPHVPCLWTDTTDPTFNFTIIVDDFAIKWHNQASYDRLKSVMDKKYTCTHQPVLRKFAGTTIDYDRSAGTLFVTAPGYLDKVLHEFRDWEITPQPTPRLYVPPLKGIKGPQQLRDQTSPAVDAASKTRLQSVVGSVLWYARTVDVTFLEAVGALSTEQGAPTEASMTAARHLLGNCAAYPNNGTMYRASDMKLKCCSDASWNSRSKGRSVAGGIWHLGNNDDDSVNGNIAAMSSIIDVVCSSAYEAELAAVYMNMQRGEWLRSVLNGLGYPQPVVDVATDNEVAVSFANDTCKLTRSKSIDLRFHWIRDRVRQGHFKVIWVKGIENIADFFTKPLPGIDYSRWIRKLVYTPPGSGYKKTMRRRRLPTTGIRLSHNKSDN